MPAITVATLIPLAVFYASLAAGSITAAIVTSVIYAYGIAGWQWLRRRRVSGMLVVTTFMVTARAGTALISGHAFAYFVLPVAETAGFGLMFLATMFSSEPLILRLVRDLVPHLADGLAERRRLIRWLSAVWTVTYLASGGTTLLLLLTQSIPVFVTVHELLGWLWVAAGVGVSITMCRWQARPLWDAAIHHHEAAPVAVAVSRPEPGRPFALAAA